MEKNIVGTPYDDVFRTLLNDCTSLIIPIVNEIFGENYTGSETVEFLQNEHFINLGNMDTKEKITDSCFRIKGITDKKYHIECQSTTDNSMTIRMFEYDSQIALDNGKVLSEYIKCTLIDMSKKVIENIAARYANVKKGVTSIMGGKILEYEAKTILEDGKEEGKIELCIELIKEGLMDISGAAKRLNIKEEELKKYL